MKRNLVLVVQVLFILNSYSQDNNDYFGQKPPGDIPQIFAPGIVSVPGRFDYGISFSPNGNEMVFGVLDTTDFSGVFYYSKRTEGKWCQPKIMTEFDDSTVCMPFFTPDGKALLYTQGKSRAMPEITDIYILKKKEGGTWAKPIKLEKPVSSCTREGYVVSTMDGTLYFSSNRDCYQEEICLADIFTSKIENGKYKEAEPVTAFNTTSDEESVYVSPYEGFAIIRRYVDSKTGTDLFISFKENGEWGKPTRLGDKINSSGWEQRPFVTFDKKYLFFTRRIDYENGRSESDIYWVDIEKYLRKS